MTVPASKKRLVNRITEVVRRILDADPDPFSDLTHVLGRIESKAIAHASGDRLHASNVETLAIDPNCSLQDYGLLVVVDDVMASGSSFVSVDEMLRESGFAGRVVNFALFRTSPSGGADYFMAVEVEMLDGYGAPSGGGTRCPHRGVGQHHGRHRRLPRRRHRERVGALGRARRLQGARAKRMGRRSHVRQRCAVHAAVQGGRHRAGCESGRLLAAYFLTPRCYKPLILVQS